MRQLQCAAAALSIVAAGAVSAQKPFAATAQRAGTWEVSADLLFQDGKRANGENRSSADLDSDVGIAFGFAYHFTDHWQLGGDFQFTSPDYQATFIDENDQPETVRATADFFTGQVRATWNVLARALTPYAEIGLGWTYVDSNVADQPPITGCWWDPWWGYICDTFWSTYDETNFSWTFGAGLRWDVNDQFVLRGGYTRLQIDVGGSNSDPGLDIFRLGGAWRF